jgi:uncharacterized phage-associated protein
MIYSALEVSNYIVHMYRITLRQLQAVLYFLQAYFLVEFHYPLFAEPILATETGPKVQGVEEAFQNKEKISGGKKHLTAQDKNQIRARVREWLTCSPAYLHCMTLRSEPYEEAFARGENEVISLESLYKFYRREADPENL